jgi:hypothetical protein
MVYLQTTPDSLAATITFKFRDINRFYRGLTMMYSTQSSWVFGLLHRPVFSRVQIGRFGNGMFPSSDEGGRKHLLLAWSRVIKYLCKSERSCPVIEISSF